MDSRVKFYRCGQCSRLDKGEGTVVIVVEHQVDMRHVNMYPSPTNVSYVDYEREVRLCGSCYMEVSESYG